mmetsp:Transcript_2325/g.5809  ORF Transcript_2325/g.5809 Transcript_2325/m.5809 type:complete len:108 (-) Transcript_2325:21-344(-)
MEDVVVRTLDSLELPRVDVIKIDVEEHAAQVLAGGTETLRRHRPILWFEDDGIERPEALQRPEPGYLCTRLEQTTEGQFSCVPQERHAEVQERLNAERPTFEVGSIT